MHYPQQLPQDSVSVSMLGAVVSRHGSAPWGRARLSTGAWERKSEHWVLFIFISVFHYCFGRFYSVHRDIDVKVMYILSK